MNNQQYEDAYRMLSSTLKDRLGPLDDYIYQNIYNLEYGRTPVYSDIEVTGVHGKKYTAEIDWQGRWIKRDGGEVWRACVALMVLEDGTWRVDSLLDLGNKTDRRSQQGKRTITHFKAKNRTPPEGASGRFAGNSRRLIHR